MGERFFRRDDLSVSVYNTFDTLVNTNGHLFLQHLSMLASVSNDYSYALKLSAAFLPLVHVEIMQTISLVGQGDDGPGILLKFHSFVRSTHAAQTSKGSSVS